MVDSLKVQLMVLSFCCFWESNKYGLNSVKLKAVLITVSIVQPVILNSSCILCVYK